MVLEDKLIKECIISKASYSFSEDDRGYCGLSIQVSKECSYHCEGNSLYKNDRTYFECRLKTINLIREYHHLGEADSDVFENKNDWVMFNEKEIEES